jgi:hypothetical protein
MTRPAREDRFHALQILDVELARFVVVLNALYALWADFLDKVDTEGDQVAG